jgi:hypothetical protein
MRTLGRRNIFDGFAYCHFLALKLVKNVFRTLCVSHSKIDCHEAARWKRIKVAKSCE